MYVCVYYSWKKRWASRSNNTLTLKVVFFPPCPGNFNLKLRLLRRGELKKLNAILQENTTVVFFLWIPIYSYTVTPPRRFPKYERHLCAL